VCILMSIKKLEMGKCIKDNGIRKQEKEMEWEFSSGLMGLSMKGFGGLIRLMEEGG
jgi:hypothetical protein